ncbi:type III secretion system FliI/YscN family ATPase [Thermodesulfitimonas autotrophica]|uniref:Type III secretion system FliI/YscN family ATPase n=1 Tax=Thermodesulfitimonas autotrophica TaxID=1894989 RepID=A0A3N5ABE2_9THEO|nr:flagellar protein export ATPase FliI [Thermodesulfitimonas autotrophica]RPF42919.1 type III secretion system FliI/YscN family ATPase [Thermodesulfitimonas autotrophica]
MVNLAVYRQRVQQASLLRQIGVVTKVVGLTLEVKGFKPFVGEVCMVDVPGSQPIVAEVVGFREDVVLLMPYGELTGVCPGCRVEPRRRAFTVRVGEHLLGRILNGLGEPIDGRSLPRGIPMPVNNRPPSPLARRRIDRVFATGVRAIDGFITCGRGQRLGIFAGSGVGKSVLLGMIARFGSADVNVIALVGERGREVLEFIEKDLGPEGLQKSVVVVATSDEPALLRLRAAFVATTIAEYFRDTGRDVLLLMDSVTRFALAQREVGLAVGEPPTTRGYPPSVFALLPRLLERAGNSESGSITGFYTVLVEGDDMNEPVADAVRSIVDGHIVLKRELAVANHYPAIDVLASVSRLMPSVVTPEHRQAAGRQRELMAAYRQAEDLINIGAYVAGSNPTIDRAIAVHDQINGFLRQGPDEYTAYDEAVERLLSIERG